MQGKTINGFTLQRLLGTGGMAEVWYAENEIGMKAAVKILSDELSRNVQMKDRFLNEAKVMVKLDHPNIRKVYGYGSIDERPTIIMEYLDGSDLKAKLKRGQRFSEAQLEKWWNQLVDALNYTHSQNIVHRDIKPSNIFLDNKDDVKLLDFGIAKLTDTTSGTLTGSTLGTRIYMSPEQVKDPKRVGPKSDVYSLAVSFVHLLTGKAPYDGTTSSDFDIQYSIVSKPLDLSRVPSDWRDFLEPYLAKDPQQRPELRHFSQTQSFAANDDEGTIVEGMGTMGRPQQQAHRNYETQPAGTFEQPKAKNNKSLLWMIIAAAAVVALLVVLLFGKSGGKSGGDDDMLNSLSASMQQTNHVLSQQVDQKYTTFDEQYGMDEEKVGPYWEQARDLRNEANEIVGYIDALKAELQNKGKDASKFMIGNDGRGAAFELSQKVQGYQQTIESVMGSGYNHTIDCNPETCFKNKSLGSCVSMLNSITTEVRTAELNAVTQLLSDIHADDFTFDEISAKVFAESGYLLSGQTYKAQALVTAWKNSPLTARVRLDGGAEKEYISNAQGVIPLEWNVGVGSHSYTGIIDMLDPSTDEMAEYPFQGSFVVAPPATSISPTKMNVVYRGIDNPIAIGGGVGGEVTATASSGTLTRTGNGTYNLRPGEANEVTISVSSSGSSLGSMKLRVKDLPKPTAFIRNVVSGQVSKSALLAAGRVEAEMKDFDFNGVHYDVIGYTFRYKTRSGTTREAKTSGGAFTDEIKACINQSNVGDMFVFADIKVRGNDGKTKTLETSIGVEIK